MADDEQGFRLVGDVITLCPMSELHRIGRTLTHPTMPPVRLFALSLMCQRRPGRTSQRRRPVSSNGRVREDPGTRGYAENTSFWEYIVPHRTELLWRAYCRPRLRYSGTAFVKQRANSTTRYNTYLSCGVTPVVIGTLIAIF